MRTTVTLDKDVQRLLREAMHRSRISFKQALNAAVRAGLAPNAAAAAQRPFVVRARALGLKAGLNSVGFNKLADDLEVEGVLAKREPGGGA